MKWYAVAAGRQIGIWNDWSTVKGLVVGYSGAKYKSFDNQRSAEVWLNDNIVNTNSLPNSGANILGDNTIPMSNMNIVTDSNNNSIIIDDSDYHVYTDGSCVKEGGGWGVVVVCPTTLQVIAEYHGRPPYDPCTNNKAELYAIYAAISYLANYRIHIFSDSQYSIKSLTTWIHNWKRNGWINSKGNPVENQDLIIAIDRLLQTSNVKFSYVKAHCGQIYNERADALANAGREC